MQLRCLHADSFFFEVRDHDPDSDGHSGASADLAGSIIVFVAVEPADVDSIFGTAEAAAKRITEIADQLDEGVVALVPCAQLTDSPAPKSIAIDVIDRLVARLEFETDTVPLGESISFEIDARGHPFANQSFEIDPVEQPTGEWFVIGENGSLADVDTNRPILDDGRLADLLPFDRLADPSEGGPVLFGEDGTVLPEGVYLRDRVLDLISDRLREYGALQVERAPDADAPPPLSAPAEFSLFETTANADTASDFAPRLTTAVPTLADALTEANEQIALVSELLADLSVPVEPVCCVTGAFLDDNRDWLGALAEQFDQPLLLERRAEGEQPFRLEFVVAGEHSRLAAPAVWIGDETDTASNDSLVVQSTPVGDPIRFTAALWRTTADRDRPQFPTWLAPVQFRLISIDSDDIETCDRLADRLESTGVRVDIDDRDLPVSERLGTADEEWIPSDAVVGDADGETLRVTIRAEQTEREFTPAELAEGIGEESADWPGGARPVPRHYSDRPDALR